MRLAVATFLLIFAVTGCRSARRAQPDTSQLVSHIAYDQDGRTFEGCVDGYSVVRAPETPVVDQLVDSAVDSAVESAFDAAWSGLWSAVGVDTCDDDEDDFGPSQEEKNRAEWDRVLAKYPEVQPPPDWIDEPEPDPAMLLKEAVEWETMVLETTGAASKVAPSAGGGSR